MLNQSAEYALRAVVHLASLPKNQPASASDISSRTKVPIHYLQKLLRELTRQGLLTARRGMGGGFFLAKPSNEISVLQVLETFDASPERIEHCPLGIKGHTKLCPLHQLIDEQVAKAEKVFSNTSIRDILETKSDISPFCEVNSPVELGLPKHRPE